IAEITREEIEGENVISAKGKIVCPGFIDPHAHVEGNDACAAVMAAMGVTSVVNGNCGNSPEHLEEFLLQQEKQGFLINQFEQVGHTTLRNLAGNTDRYAASTPEQIAKMKQLAAEAMESGVYGLSFGLEYVPGSSFEEVIELAKVAAAYGKVVSIHTRKDCYAGLSSLQEAIDICRLTGAAVNVSHLTYMFGLGMAAEAIRMIELAMAEGLDVSVDSGLYSAFATEIGSAVFDEDCFEKWHSDYSCIVAGTGKYRGQRLTKEMFYDLRNNYPFESGIGMVGKEYEVYEILEHPYVMVGTDAGTQYDNGRPGHPQDAGTYPKFFKQMLREQNRISLIDAVDRCTYQVAKRFHIPNKGFLAKGADADLVVFDLSKIEDKAQYPCYGATDTRPEGITAVIIGGTLAVEGKIVNEIRPGKMYRDKAEPWQW
ncbi:MAG TPA: amidohydrolase family protein, partial [Lachnospiraceae bacterium]|nr:amidohydrolase family protein [Lachnospiraceae bacterium]